MPHPRSIHTLLVAFAGAALLGGCMTATPYQPIDAPGTSASGGFSDVQLGPNRYRVTFAGNSMTSRERVEISAQARLR